MITSWSATAWTSRQQVRGQQHGAAAVGEVAQELAHPAHPGRVEPVGRLVEDQHLGVAEQRVGEPEPLAHAERVLPDPLARGRALEPDEVEQPVDPRLADPDRLGGDGERLATAAAAVLGGRVEQDADAAGGVRQRAVAGRRAPPRRRRRGRAGRTASAASSSSPPRWGRGTRSRCRARSGSSRPARRSGRPGASSGLGIRSWPGAWRRRRPRPPPRAHSAPARGRVSDRLR